MSVVDGYNKVTLVETTVPTVNYHCLNDLIFLYRQIIKSLKPATLLLLPLFCDAIIIKLSDYTPVERL